jgi:hypothetical protein
MSFENSPSLNDFKEGLPENLPDSARGKRRMRVILGVLCSVALFLGIANFMQSKTANLLMGMGAIQGVVVDAQGAPIIGDVFIIGVDQIVRTASDGSFFLERIPSDDQSLVVADKTTGREVRVKIVAGQTLNIGQVQFISTAIPGQ